ncbi:CoA pyrophosphatase [Wenzhouxiangella sediminis]|uniref:CoA pyrophosphatase n=1 Tax=Wenzhouxiangella sediminis TaxID=1792836 RepID=A0A3E1K7R3_9GAMM|nr:CoA pyrophosphatase [Wenzhouxiangella sediminis]RFF30089.1 CoA pyrophosphatase [Wenzhouxiangella sediminis]
MGTEAASRLSTGELSARLHSPDTPEHELPIGGFRPVHGSWNPRRAAVLIPIVFQPEPAIVLTVRSRRMSLHAGQVALPGGRREADEPFPLTTALRETSEEIGIDAGRVAVHGLLDRFDTITGYRIVPVVASIEGRPELRPCPREVEEIFTLPLDAVLDPASYRKHHVTRGGHGHELYTMPHPRWMIWGATAAILHRFCTTLKDDA